mmetsp:Transcript_11653/g.32751  ORF Transcript_11653/g.32751 Transcript_11653/m.32751 type:complete len:428 (+) Transcript_11653:134-1417(+)
MRLPPARSPRRWGWSMVGDEANRTVRPGTGEPGLAEDMETFFHRPGLPGVEKLRGLFAAGVASTAIPTLELRPSLPSRPKGACCTGPVEQARPVWVPRRTGSFSVDIFATWCVPDLLRFDDPPPVWLSSTDRLRTAVDMEASLCENADSLSMVRTRRARGDSCAPRTPLSGGEEGESPPRGEESWDCPSPEEGLTSDRLIVPIAAEANAVTELRRLTRTRRGDWSAASVPPRSRELRGCCGDDGPDTFRFRAAVARDEVDWEDLLFLRNISRGEADREDGFRDELGEEARPAAGDAPRTASGMTTAGGGPGDRARRGECRATPGLTDSWDRPLFSPEARGGELGPLRFWRGDTWGEKTNSSSCTRWYFRRLVCLMRTVRILPKEASESRGAVLRGPCRTVQSGMCTEPSLDQAWFSASSSINSTFGA